MSEASTGQYISRDAVLAVRHGMSLFKQGDVEGSLVEYEKAIELNPRKRAYLWQRGLSLYYLNRFEDGAEQFRLDNPGNPNDAEEAIWCYLCEAQLYGFEEARERFIKIGRDRRLVMREAYEMFRDRGDPETFVARFSEQPQEYFYASFYAGLFYEARNEEHAAKRHIVAAYRSPYQQNSEDITTDIVYVHCQRRKWID